MEPGSNVTEHLEPGEEIAITARAHDADVLVTDRRLAIAAEDRLLLDVPFEQLRRVQFDIERSRPATLVLVPERPTDRAQVLTIAPSEYEAVSRAIALIGRHLATD
jgi:hypothetical protein